MSLTNDVDALVNGVARQVARAFRVSMSDLWQQGRLWVLAHPRRMQAWLEEDSTDSWREMERAVRAELERTARAEKAQRCGYALEDEAFYTVELLVEVLPAVLDPDLGGLPPQGEPVEVRAPSDPAVSAVWPVHLADISRALDRTPMDALGRRALLLSYGPAHMDIDAVADMLDVDAKDAERALRTVLRSMVRTLGGGRPRGCDRSCAECGGDLLTSA